MQNVRYWEKYAALARIGCPTPWVRDLGMRLPIDGDATYRELSTGDDDLRPICDNALSQPSSETTPHAHPHGIDSVR